MESGEKYLWGEVVDLVSYNTKLSYNPSVLARSTTALVLTTKYIRLHSNSYYLGRHHVENLGNLGVTNKAIKFIILSLILSVHIVRQAPS